MADKTRVEVNDPTIESAEVEAGTQYPTDGEYPNGEYVGVDVEHDEASYEITVGDTLMSGDHEHGEVDRIVRHPDNGDGAGPERRWNWTIYFDYTGASYGGCPLGELTRQLSAGAELV